MVIVEKLRKLEDARDVVLRGMGLIDTDGQIDRQMLETTITCCLRPADDRPLNK